MFMLISILDPAVVSYKQVTSLVPLKSPRGQISQWLYESLKAYLGPFRSEYLLNMKVLSRS